ncbi:MAG: BREX system P-loop protein BrxC, partial [Candidatus Cloacimonadota bacterium]|nr:BREX system P-loop protein BrxC [Candidatus Cloacimonadota bacterium]
GKHSSVGERSMLGVFQQVAVHIADHGIRELSTFDLMFEGIRTALKSQIQSSVLMAEKNLDDDFAIRILKALFLVKYVKSFKASLRNISILMLDNFDRNVSDLQKQVEESLGLLEQQTYIQRNGELYEFLTDEEKDVEQEIKNTDVENSEVNKALENIIFDHVLKSRKIRYDENGQDYPFSRKLDGALCGREHELSINIITPFNELIENETTLSMQSMGKDELLVIMPADDRFYHDLVLLKKTDKHVRINFSQTQQETIKRILSDKSLQNREREKELQTKAKELLGEAKCIINLKPLDDSSTDPQTKIIKGFFDLLRRTYPNLNMLGGIKYTENDITTCLTPQGATLFGNDEKMMSEAEQEMLAYIQGNSRNGVRTTLKTLLERFEKKPYGWYFAAILCVLAKLCAREKIEVRSDSNILEEKDLEKALRNTGGHNNVILDPQIDFTGSQVRQLKTFYEEFFDTPPKANEARPLGREALESLKTNLQKLEPLVNQVNHYPFLTVLAEPIKRLQELSKKEYSFFLTDLSPIEDDLLDIKEDILDPVQRFMSGSPKDIYDDSKRFLEEQNANFAGLTGDESQQVKDILADAECFKGNKMQQLKGLVDTLREQVSLFIEQEKQQALEILQTLRDELTGMDDFSLLSDSQREELLQDFIVFKEKLQSQKIVAVIRQSVTSFKENTFLQLLSRKDEWIAEQQEKDKKDGYTGKADSENEDPGKTSTGETQRKYISKSKISVKFSKSILENENDVDAYAEAIKEAYLAEVKLGKRVQI